MFPGSSVGQELVGLSHTGKSGLGQLIVSNSTVSFTNYSFNAYLLHTHTHTHHWKSLLLHIPPILSGLWFLFGFHQVLVAWILVNKGIFNELWNKTKETSSLPLVSLQKGKGNLALQRDTLQCHSLRIYLWGTCLGNGGRPASQDVWSAPAWFWTDAGVSNFQISQGEHRQHPLCISLSK